MKVQPKSPRQKDLALRQTPPGKSRKFEKEVGREAGRGETSKFRIVHVAEMA